MTDDTQAVEQALVAAAVANPEIVQASAQMNFTKDDLLDIGSDHAEEVTEEQLRIARVNRDKAKTKLDQAKAKLDAATGQILKGMTDEAQETLQHALDEIYPVKERPKVVAEFTLEREEVLAILGTKLPKALVYNVRLSLKSGYGSQFPLLKRTIDVPQAVVEAHAAWGDMKAVFDDAEQIYQTWLTAQARMPQFRRKLKSKLAQAQLKRTVGGQKVLDTLLGNMNKELESFARAAMAQRQLKDQTAGDAPRRQR